MALERLGRLAEASGGLHQVIGGDCPASEAGQSLAARCGDLFVTGFDLSGCTAAPGETVVSVTFAAGGELICRQATTVALPELPEIPNVPETPELPETEHPRTAERRPSRTEPGRIRRGASFSGSSRPPPSRESP